MSMATKPHSKLVKVIGSLAGTLGVAMMLLGDRLNHDQMLGCLLVGTFMIVMSFLFFLMGAMPFRELVTTDRAMRWAFVFACGSLAYAVLQIPVWCWMTHSFPPDSMSSTQALWATMGVLVSLAGPFAPLAVRISRRTV
jgi:hypothetical protein